MRLLKTHSHTSERPGYEARKNAKKVIEGSADTIRRQTAYRRRGRGGETKKGELKENTGAKTRETEDKGNQSQNPPAGYHRGGGGRDKRRKPTRNGKVAQPTVPRGGEVPSRKRVSKEKAKQRASQR